MIKNQLQLKKAAYQYLSNHWSIIPLIGKQSMGEWKEFQTRFPSHEEVEQWFNDDRVTGIGIVTGKLSKLVVLDIDQGSDYQTKLLPPTLSSLTGSGGLHFYFQYSDLDELKNRVGFQYKTDFKTEGGYVVAPPSIHPTTEKYYEWINEKASPAPIPQQLILDVIKQKQDVQNGDNNIFAGVSSGERNQAATSVIGKLLGVLDQRDWETSAWELVRGWNLRNQPPLEESELRNVFVSIYNRELNKRTKNNKPLTSFTLSDLLAKDYPDSEWLIEHLVPKNSITCLSGKPGVGKSFLTLYLAKALTTKNPFLGKFKTHPSTVCILSKEDPQQLIQKRIKLLGFNKTLPVVFSDDMTALCNDEQQLQRLRELIQRTKSEVLIIDSFIRVVGGDENLSKDVTKVHEVFKRLTQEGITVIFTHHQGKEDARQSGIDKPRGSSDIGAMVDSLINVTKKDQILTIDHAKSRWDIPTKPFYVQFPDFENSFDFEFLNFKKDDHGLEEITPIDEATSNILSLLDRTHEPIHQAGIIKELSNPNYSDSTVKNALTHLEEVKKVVAKRIGGKKYFQSINRHEDISDDQMSEIIIEADSQAESI